MSPSVSPSAGSFGPSAFSCSATVRRSKDSASAVLPSRFLASACRGSSHKGVDSASRYHPKRFFIDGLDCGFGYCIRHPLRRHLRDCGAQHGALRDSNEYLERRAVVTSSKGFR